MFTMTKGLGWQVRDASFYRGSDLMSPRAFTHGGHMGMRAVVDPDYELVTVFMTSTVTTSGTATAAGGPVGVWAQTFGTMAVAAIVQL